MPTKRPAYLDLKPGDPWMFIGPHDNPLLEVGSTFTRKNWPTMLFEVVVIRDTVIEAKYVGPCPPII